MTEALTRLAQDKPLRTELIRKGLKRAAEFSWTRTADLTLEAYQEAAEPAWGLRRRSPAERRSFATDECRRDLQRAIRKTVDYAKLFQFPLEPREIRERLFDIEVDEATFDDVLRELHLEPDHHLLRLRAQREQISDRAIRSIQPCLGTLASMPFVRMLAFSGATAHRNMTSEEDIDVFMIVEDGKLWAVCLIATFWAKLKGLRKRLCLNYMISDNAMPILEQDIFTAQQVASLKPFYGKGVYETFIHSNTFVRRCFPNFDPSWHRNRYPEIRSGRAKPVLETVLRMGPVQLLESAGWCVMRRYLLRKIGADSDVQLEPRRIKLHLQSHKAGVLKRVEL
jgi:hypothetical protein